MKRLITLFFIAAAILSASAAELPEGSKVLYKGEQRYERYGMYWHCFTVYAHAGKFYLIREQSFSGAAEIIVDADGIARNARYVKTELSKKQVKKLCEAIKNADFIGKIKAYDDEVKAYENAVKEEQEAERKKSMVITEKGDTIYKLKTVKHRTSHFHMPTLWNISIDWQDIATDIHSAGEFYQDEKAPPTWKVKGRPARSALINAVHNVNGLLDEWAYKYKLRNSDIDEMYIYRYTISGGMTARYRADGRMSRQGTRICLEKEKGKWLVSGYLDEREDTVEVSEDVARKVEKMSYKLNIKALNPTLKDGEKLLKAEASDSPYWEIYVGYLTKENINTGDGTHSKIMEPRHAAKQYDKLLEDINAINDYLWSFLRLKAR